MPTIVSKYKAVPCVRDGVRFASQREASRYGELKAAEKAGIISNLELQFPFALHVGKTIIGRYVADFVYRDSQGRQIVEDCKGMKTPLYNWKKRHMLAEYDIPIVET
jgi:hypothetical protein